MSVELESYIDLEDIEANPNIAEMFSDKDLETIGSLVVDEYEVDERSREEWLNKSDDWLELALQVKEQKNFPWPNAANIKYPLLTTASLQFSARSYPALIPAPNIVRTKVVGQDDTGELTKAASRISAHMNYQLLEEMEEWEDDMDKLLLMTPIIGCIFKKIYYDPLLKRNMSELCTPKEVVIDYYASSIDTARRITHIIEMPMNDMIERMRNEIYLDYEDNLGSTSRPEDILGTNKRQVEENSIGTHSSEDTPSGSYPRVVLEQHRYLDLDGDNYEEPYIVTVDLNSKKVLRIIPRFDIDTVERNSRNKISKIKSNCYFVKYGFIPNPDGGIYDIGFGILQGPLNDTVNSIINQLLDAGTLANTGAGIISKGLRIKQGTLRFRPGQFHVSNATPEMIQKGIYTLPTPQPSPVLFQLLELILGASQRISSTTELNLGESPGQNQPATTTLALLEQGQKIFTAIHKRLRKSMKNELRLLARLNKKYLPVEAYFDIVDYTPVNQQSPENVIGRSDYELTGVHIFPTANPNVISETQKLIKAQSLLEKMVPLNLNYEEVRIRVLEAEDQPNIEALLKPNPKQESLEEAEFRHQVEKDFEDLQIRQNESEVKIVKDVATAVAQEAKATKDYVAGAMSELTELREGLKIIIDHYNKEQDRSMNEQNTPETSSESQ